MTTVQSAECGDQLRSVAWATLGGLQSEKHFVGHPLVITDPPVVPSFL